MPDVRETPLLNLPRFEVTYFRLRAPRNSGQSWTQDIHRVWIPITIPTPNPIKRLRQARAFCNILKPAIFRQGVPFADPGPFNLSEQTIPFTFQVIFEWKSREYMRLELEDVAIPDVTPQEEEVAPVRPTSFDIETTATGAPGGILVTNTGSNPLLTSTSTESRYQWVTYDVGIGTVGSTSTTSSATPRSLSMQEFERWLSSSRASITRGT